LYNTLVEMFTDSQEGAPEPPAAGKRPSPFAHVVSQPLHILLAEDNVVNQKIAVRLLERMGYRPDVVANGLEVLDAVKRQQYDVILMDVQMPEMDGVEATRHIRERMLSDDQPWIIAMTAYAMEGDREWCLEAGMDDYVRKPVRVEELIQALQRVPVGEGHSIVGDGSG
jgi:CheY-like chemotaxis protein